MHLLVGPERDYQPRLNGNTVLDTFSSPRTPATHTSPIAAAINLCPRSSSHRHDRYKCLAMFGNGPNPVMRPTLGTHRLRALLGNTTASSCATNMCCVAAHVQHQLRICVQVIATSSQLMRSGNS